MSATNKGGYQIISLQNHNFTNAVGFVIEGIYEKFEGTRKTLLLTDIVVDGVEVHDRFCNFRKDGTNYVTNFIAIEPDECIFTIQDNDVVTMTW